MFNILFIYAKENKDILYKQGFNEILGIILLAIYPYYFDNKNNKLNEENVISLFDNINKNYKLIYLFMHDQDELAADLFYIFDLIMNKGIKELYETNNKKDNFNQKRFDLFNDDDTFFDELKDQLPLHKRCHLIIKEKLKIFDEELSQHFNKIDMPCTVFLQRWLKCMFSREFHSRDVILLWDSIIANDLIDSSLFPQQSYPFMFIDLISVAMINYIREDCIYLLIFFST